MSYRVFLTLQKLFLAVVLLSAGYVHSAVDTDKEFIEDQLLEAEAITNLYQHNDFQDLQVKEFDIQGSLKAKPDPDTFDADFIVNPERARYFYHAIGFKLALSSSLVSHVPPPVKPKANKKPINIPLHLQLSDSLGNIQITTTYKTESPTLLKILNISNIYLFITMMLIAMLLGYGLHRSALFLQLHRNNQYAAAVLDLPKNLFLLLPVSIFVMLKSLGLNKISNKHIPHAHAVAELKPDATVDQLLESTIEQVTIEPESITDVPSTKPSLEPTTTYGSTYTEPYYDALYLPQGHEQSVVLAEPQFVSEPIDEFHYDFKSMHHVWTNDAIHGAVKQLKSYKLAPQDIEPVLNQAKEIIQEGRVREAGFMLVHCIEDQPTQSLTPWLLLFDIYRSLDQPSEFSALTQKFCQTFNVIAPLWESATDDSKALAQFPQITDKLSDLASDEQATREYIEDLIFEATEREENILSIQALTELFGIKEKLQKSTVELQHPQKNL